MQSPGCSALCVYECAETYKEILYTWLGIKNTLTPCVKLQDLVPIHQNQHVPLMFT